MKSNSLIMNHNNILSKLKIADPQLLGSGMEGYVYNFAEDRVIKIWRDKLHDQKHLDERKNLYEVVGRQLQVNVPEIYEIGLVDNITYTIEKKLIGKPGHIVFLNSNKSEQKKLLNNYYDLLLDLKNVQIDGSYGQILSGSKGKVQDESWTGFIRKKLDESKSESILKPDHNISNISELFNKFFVSDLNKINSKPKKSLVHGDIFLENVMVGENNKITGLLDFGPLTVIGDHILDVTGLTHFATVTEGIDSDTLKYLQKKTEENYPKDLEIINVYLAYYSLFFINSKSYDPRTYDWCLNNLKTLGYL